MYTVLYEGQTIFDPRIDNLKLTDMSGTISLNEISTFDFTIPNTNPFYDKIEKMRRDKEIEVYKDSILQFSGRVRDIDSDFYEFKEVSCEGEAAYLDDVTLPIYSTYDNGDSSYVRAPDTIDGLFEWYIIQYNKKANGNQVFNVGINEGNLLSSTNKIYTESDSRPGVLSEILEKIVNSYGAYIRTYKKDGAFYIDLLCDGTTETNQIIEFGKNMLDYTHSETSDNFMTRITPIGTKTDSTDNKSLTISTISDKNLGDGYVKTGESIINTTKETIYGTIEKVVNFETENVTVLFNAAFEYLKKVDFDETLTVKAVDLSILDNTVSSLGVGKFVRCKSKYHNLDKYMICTQFDFNPSSPEDDEYTLGEGFKGLTGRQGSRISDLNQTLNSEIISVTNIANSKNKTFKTENIPNTPYSEGDIWTQGATGDVYVCITSKSASQSSSINDWALASKYTDDTVANQAKTAAETAASAASNALASANEAKTSANEAKTAANEAKSQAQTATTYANEAKTQAQTATDYADEAKAQSQIAKNQATEAKTQAQTATTYANDAKSQAQAATEYSEEAKEEALTAKTAADNAGVHATAAEVAANAVFEAFYREYGTRSYSDSDIATYCALGYESDWDRTTGYYQGAVDKGDILIIYVTQTSKNNTVAKLYIRVENDCAVAPAKPHGTVIQFDEVSAWFWHDSNGAHVLSNVDGTRTDMTGDGMTIYDNQNGANVAHFGVDGIEFDNDTDFMIGIDDSELDVHSYVKYDGDTHSIDIRTNKLTLASGGNTNVYTKTETDSVAEERAASLLRIESSRGTVFKNDSVSTVLTVTIFKSSNKITNISELHSVYGSSSYLQWYWLRLNDSEYGIISASDPKLSNDGFTLTLSPADVDTKVTFRCELIV